MGKSRASRQHQPASETPVGSEWGQESENAPEPGILVDRQIRGAMAHGFIAIDPFDEDALQPATYDLGVGDIAVTSTAPKPIDLREKPLLVIEPYASAMLQTVEVLTLSP